MKRLTAFWLSACFLCTISVQAQSFIPERDSSDISLFEYATKIPKRNNVFNLDLEMHASFNTFFIGHKLDEAAFRFNHIKIEATGEVNDRLFYWYRQNLNQGNEGMDLENLPESIEYAMIGYRLNDKFTITLGKQDAAWGGFEYDLDPYAIYEYSDMNEYMEKHAVSRLIGAPPGYVGFDQGGLLTEQVNKKPHCVLLLDEIEKAHPDIYNILLQVMDHGTLTDNNGRKADFRNVVLVMTTNAGVRETERKSIGLIHQDNSPDAMDEIKKIFTPEFRNRLDNIIWFDHLSTEVIHQVVDKFIVELQVQLDQKGVSLEVSQEARNWLAEKGYDRAMGARPMARVIQDNLKKPLANELLFGSLVDGGQVTVALDQAKNELTYDFQSAAKHKPEAAH